MECCLNKLGNFPHNKIIETSIIAEQDGIHLLYLKSANGGTFMLAKELEAGQELTINVGQLNESMCYNFKVEQPDGTFFMSNDCPNFQLQTIINSQIDGCDNTCDNDTDSSNNYGY